MSEVYKVGVAIALSSNAAQIFGALGQHFLKLDKHVTDFQNNWKKAMLIGGGLSFGAGILALDTMTKLVEKTKDYSEELVKLKNLGGEMAIGVNNGEVAKRAFDISQRIPLKVTDIMKIAGATNSTLGYEESMKHQESFARTAFVLQSQKDYKGDVGADLQALIKAGDMMGRLTDPKTGQIDSQKLDAFLDTATRAINATHGMVSPQVLLGMAKQGSLPSRGLSEDGFLTQIMMAQMMGGPRSGTALMSMWQQMAGGQMMSRSAQGLEEIGLLKSDEWKNDHGHVVLGDAASHRLTKMIGKDPLEFTANIVKNLKERGILDPEEQMRMVMRALGRQTTQRYTGEQVANFQQMLSERERIKQGMGSQGAFTNIMNESVEANLKALGSAWDNLLYAVAGPNSQNVISVLQGLTSAFNWMQRTVTHMDPSTLVTLGTGIAGLAVALTGGGAVALLAALGPAGWLAMGLIGLGGILITWGPQIFDQIKADFSKYADLMKADFSRISDAFTGFITWLSTIAEKIRSLFGGGKGGEFGKDLKGANESYVPMRFDPGEKKIKAQPISLSLNVDGRTLAQSMSEQLDYLYEHATGAPAYNGQSHFGRADGGLSGV